MNGKVGKKIENCRKCKAQMIPEMEIDGYVLHCPACGNRKEFELHPDISDEKKYKYGKNSSFKDNARNMGLAVVIKAVMEEGVEYLYSYSGRWWLKVLDIDEDWVIEQCILHEALAS